MPKLAKPLPVLTDEQKATIDGSWQDDAQTLLAKVWPDRPELNLRTIHWKAIRAYMALMGRDPDAPQAKSNAAASLTDEQQAFVASNYADASGPTELARTMFRDPKLMPGSSEVRCVTAYIRKIDPTYRREEELCEEIEYHAPKNANNLIGILNRFGVGQREDGRALSTTDVTPAEQKQLEALLRHMRRPTFKVEAEKFTRRIDREIFEENFLSSCWNKPDLAPEHVLQYITLASLSVQRNQADRLARKLNDRFEASLEDSGQRLSKTEVDALKETAAKQTEYVKQVNTLIRTLEGDRSKQVSERLAGSSSMHPLVLAWKSKQDRDRIIATVRKHKQTPLRQEVERLSSMDAIKAELFGLDPHTITH